MELMLRMIPLLDPLQSLSTCTQLLMLILWMMRSYVVRQGQQFAIYTLSRDRSHIPRNGVKINILKMWHVSVSLIRGRWKRIVVWGKQVRWWRLRGRHNLDAARGNQRSTCISSLSGNISLVLLSAIKALSNLGWLVGVSRWWGVGWCMSRRSWCMMSREQTVDRLLYRPNPVWRANLQQQPARKRPTVFLYFFNPLTSPDGRLKISPFYELQIINCQTMYFGNLLGQCHDIQWVNDLEVYDFPVLMDFFFISLPPFVNVQPHRMWTSRQ